MSDQRQLFAKSRRLADLPIEARIAGAARVLDAEPNLSVDDRRPLLPLVFAPQLGGEVER